MKDNKRCYRCNGEYDERYVDVPCPDCGRQYKKENEVDLNQLVKTDTKFLNTIKSLEIPKEYLGITWSRETLDKDKEEDKSLRIYQGFAQQLERVHDIFESGLIPPKSALVIAPIGYSKVTWAYSCMQQAVAHGFSVAPLLDTVELKRLFVLSSEKPNFKMFGLTYEDYIEKDICFVAVTKSEYVGHSWQTILDILDKRSRKGLPTFIISRYGVDAISKWDYDGQFKVLLEQGGLRNSLKYPAIISYSKTI